MTSLLLDIAAVASELTDRHQHVERIWDRDAKHRNKRMRRCYVTSQDGLLQQLADAVFGDPGGSDNEGGSRPVPGSRPPGAWEAMARHSAITIAATKWCWDLRIQLRDTVEDNIRALVGKAAELDHDTSRALLHDLRHWRGQAAAMTGWAARTFAPQVPCPLVDCGRTNTLRINLDRSVATCISCECLWEEADGSFAVLAGYVERAAATTTHTRERIRSGKAGNGGWLADTPTG